MSPQPETTAPETAPMSESSADSGNEQMVQTTVEAAEDKKAERLKVLDLAAISDFTDRFVICSGTNERQVEAIADSILAKLRAAGHRPLHVEGQGVGRWILMDFGGELVVHVFLHETREHYGLERLWSDAPDLTPRFATAV